MSSYRRERPNSEITAITAPTPTTTKMTMPSASCIHEDCAHVATAATQDHGAPAPGALSGPIRAGARHGARADRLDRTRLVGILRLRRVPSPQALTDQSIAHESRSQPLWSISR